MPVLYPHFTLGFTPVEAVHWWKASRNPHGGCDFGTKLTVSTWNTFCISINYHKFHDFVLMFPRYSSWSMFQYIPVPYFRNRALARGMMSLLAANSAVNLSLI